MDVIKHHGLEGNILFWHTGGLMNMQNKRYDCFRISEKLKPFGTLDSLKGSPVKHALLKIKGLEQEETCDDVL